VKATVLVVDDEPDVIDLIRYSLEQAGLKVESATSGAEALLSARKLEPQLILLDVMLPEMDGLEVCKAFKADPRTAGIPIIMVTAKSGEIDRVIGLELGADDYVTKPFSPRELVLRVKKRLQQAAPGGPPKETFRFGPLAVDVARHQVTVRSKRIELTAKEFKLLVALIERAGRVQSRDQLLRDVWEYDAPIDTRTVDTHVRRLREKLGSAARHLDTVRGVGYRFVERQGAAEVTV